jgi:hypothetical protein
MAYSKGLKFGELRRVRQSTALSTLVWAKNRQSCVSDWKEWSERMDLLALPLSMRTTGLLVPNQRPKLVELCGILWILSDSC